MVVVVVVVVAMAIAMAIVHVYIYKISSEHSWCKLINSIKAPGYKVDKVDCTCTCRWSTKR